MTLGILTATATPMYTAHHADLKILLDVTRPASILLLDPNPEGLPAESLSSNCQVVRLEGNSLTQLPELGRFDLGVVANTLEYLDRKTAGILMARLRDIHTRRFVVLAPIGQVGEGQASYWETTDFLGYGMTLLARYQVDGKALHLYHYAIESYKTAPAWFNSKYWAHPERWKP